MSKIIVSLPPLKYQGNKFDVLLITHCKKWWSEGVLLITKCYDGGWGLGESDPGCSPGDPSQVLKDK